MTLVSFVMADYEIAESPFLAFFLMTGTSFPSVSLPDIIFSMSSSLSSSLPGSKSSAAPFGPVVESFLPKFIAFLKTCKATFYAFNTSCDCTPGPLPLARPPYLFPLGVGLC